MEVKSLSNVVIVEGKSLKEICKFYSVHLGSLYDYVVKTPARADAYRTALIQSAEIYAQKAEEILLNLPPGATNAEIQRAKELAWHWRWMASKRNPTYFNDRVIPTTSVDTTKKIIRIIEEEDDDKYKVKSFPIEYTDIAPQNKDGKILPEPDDVPSPPLKYK